VARLVTIAMMLVTVGFIAGCDSGESAADADEAAGAAAEKEAYLEQLGESRDGVVNAIGDVGRSLESAWPTRQRLVTLLQEADFRNALGQLRTDVEAIDPPPAYASDHDRIVQAFVAIDDMGERWDRALAQEDLLSVAAFTAEMEVLYARMLADVSPSICQALQGGIPVNLCAREDAAPHDYARQLDAIDRRFLAEFQPRVSAFLPAMSEDELIAALLYLQPPIIAALEQAHEDASALEPPDEFRADHERYLRYLEETLTLSRQISSAAEAGDANRLRFELFPASGEILCSAAEDLRTEFKELIVAERFDEC
jgi:hypothetical protein